MLFYILTLTFGIEFAGLVSGQFQNGFQGPGPTFGRSEAQSSANTGDHGYGLSNRNHQQASANAPMAGNFHLSNPLNPPPEMLAMLQSALKTVEDLQNIPANRSPSQHSFPGANLQQFPAGPLPQRFPPRPPPKFAAGSSPNFPNGNGPPPNFPNRNAPPPNFPNGNPPPPYFPNGNPPPPYFPNRNAPPPNFPNGNAPPPNFPNRNAPPPFNRFPNHGFNPPPQFNPNPNDFMPPDARNQDEWKPQTDASDGSHPRHIHNPRYPHHHRRKYGNRPEWIGGPQNVDKTDSASPDDTKSSSDYSSQTDAPSSKFKPPNGFFSDIMSVFSTSEDTKTDGTPVTDKFEDESNTMQTNTDSATTSILTSSNEMEQPTILLTTAMFQGDTSTENAMHSESGYSSFKSDSNNESSKSDTSEETEVVTTEISDISNADVSEYESKNVASYSTNFNQALTTTENFSTYQTTKISTEEANYSEDNTEKSMSMYTSSNTFESPTEEPFVGLTTTLGSELPTSMPATIANTLSTTTEYSRFPSDASNSVSDIQPTADSLATTEIQLATESLATTEIQPATESLATTVIQPATESLATTEIQPTTDVLPSTNIASVSNIESTTDTLPVSQVTPSNSQLSSPTPTDETPELYTTISGEYSEGSDSLKTEAFGSTARDSESENTSEGFTASSDTLTTKAIDSATKGSETDENKTEGYTVDTDSTRKITDTSEPDSIATESENAMNDEDNSKENEGVTEATDDTNIEESDKEFDSDVVTTKSNSCKDEEEWWECKPTKHNTCENFARAEARKDFQCDPGCFCQYGLILTGDGECVEPIDCPDPVCQSHESATDCMNPCNTCEANCGPCEILDCVPGCDCLDGFKRDTNGSCVHATECPVCTTPTVPTISIDITTAILPENSTPTASSIYTNQVTATSAFSFAAPIDTSTAPALTDTT